MLAPATLPLPLLTVQFCPAGWVSTEALYPPPLFSAPEKVKTPLAFTARLLPPLFWKTTLVLVAKPATEPLMV